MAGEKKLRTEKLLKSTASDDVLNLSLEVLKLPRDVEDKVKHFNYVESAVSRVYYYKTIGDLLKRDRSGLLGLLAKSSMRYIEAQEFVNKVEQKLAKFGLKFADSDFTVLDVNIDELDVGRLTKSFLKSLPKHINNLCDLSIQSKAKLKSRLHQDSNYVIADIERAMEEYGVKFLESSYKLDKQKFFPINKILAKQQIEMRK